MFTKRSTSAVPFPITSNVIDTKSDSFEKSTRERVEKLPLILPLVFSLITAEDTLGIKLLIFAESNESFEVSYFNSHSELINFIAELSLYETVTCFSLEEYVFEVDGKKFEVAFTVSDDAAVVGCCVVA